MSITISTYTTFDELRALLQGAEGVNFVVPTSQDGEWLLGALGNWSDLYRKYADGNVQKLRQIDPPDHRLILKFITEKFKQDNPEITKKLPGIARSGFVDLLSDALHELLREEIPSERIEHEVLTPLYKNYIEYLAQNGLMDSTQVATKTRELVREKIFDSPVIFAGFLSFTHGQKKLIEKMGEFEKIHIFKPEAKINGLYDASAQFAKHPRGHTSEHDGGKYFLFDSLDTQSELVSLARELALWSSGEGIFSGCEFPGWGNIGILTQKNRTSELETALARYHIPASCFFGRSVSETPIGYLPKRIYSAHCGGWRDDDAQLLLAHPCFGAASVALEAMKKFCKSIEGGGNPTQILEILFNFVSTKNIWLDSLQKIIGDDESGAFDFLLREVASAIAELERKLIFMKELQPKVGAAGDIRFSGHSAIEYIQNWTQEAQITTPPPIENSVSVFDSLPPLASFQVFAVTGVSARNFPGNITASPLLDDEMKQKLNELIDTHEASHLATTHEQRLQKDALLKRLLWGGENFAIISRPLNDDKGRPLTPSSSLAPVLGSPKWERLEHTKIDSKFYFSQIEICEYEKNIFRAPPIEKCAPLFELNISNIDDLTECPFLFWARNIKKISEPACGIYDKALTGSLAHHIWERAWQIKSQNSENLTKIVPEIWDILSKEPKIYEALFIDKRLIRRKEFLRAQMIQSAILQDEIEKKLKGQRTGIETEKKVSFTRDGVLFNGKSDRIDLLRSGCVVIDYKSGNFEQNFQLGGYAIAMIELGRNVLGAGNITLKKNEVLGKFDASVFSIYTNKKKGSAIDELIAETETALSAAAATVKAGEYKPNYDSKLCRNCALKSLCRRAEMCGETNIQEDEPND